MTGRPSVSISFSAWTELRTHHKLAEIDKLPCPPGEDYVVYSFTGEPPSGANGREIELFPCLICGMRNIHIHKPIIEGWPLIVGPVHKSLLDLFKLYTIKETPENDHTSGT